MYCFKHWERIRAKSKLCNSLWDFTGPQGDRKRGWPDTLYGAGRVMKMCPGDEEPVWHSAVMIQEPIEYVTIYLDGRGMDPWKCCQNTQPCLIVSSSCSPYLPCLLPLTCSSHMSLRANIISALQSCCPENQPCEKASPQAWQAVLHRPPQLRKAWLYLRLPL